MRKRVPFTATLLTFALLTSTLVHPARAHAQTPETEAAKQQTQTNAQATPTPTPKEDDDGDVVRITTNLVQFDAVVTDKKGQQVTDLRPEDFEVSVNGRRQAITNFSYVVAEAGAGVAAGATPASRANNKNAPYIPPARVKPSDVRRTIALVVDDLGTSFEDIAYVRQALKKFVEEQMQEGDLVAIMRTSAGMGALQQFTSDKNILRRAIERVRWNPMGRGGLSAFAPMEPPNPADAAMQKLAAAHGGKGKDDDSDNAKERDASQILDDFREQVFPAQWDPKLGIHVT